MNSRGSCFCLRFRWTCLLLLLVVGWSQGLLLSAASPPHKFRLAWTNNILTVTHPDLPVAKLEILYLEAFLRHGANQQDWNKTRFTHHTTLIGTNPNQTELRFHTVVDPGIDVFHEIHARPDLLDFTFTFTNRGPAPVDLQWFQPACIRVAGFTGRSQSNFTSRSFVYTSAGRSWLQDTHRTTEALYHGGQVFLPSWTQPQDANPRPIAGDRLTNGLIGCVSADDQWLLGVASDRTHELFEGVYVCLHSDPWIGGLAPGEVKRIRQRIYFIPNDPAKLLKAYQRDFPGSTKGGGGGGGGAAADAGAPW